MNIGDTPESVVYSEICPPVGRIVLNRPEKLNVINIPMKREFLRAMDTLLDDDEVRVIVVKGNGKSFCAGYDLNPGVHMEAKSSGTRTVANDLAWVSEEGNFWQRLWMCPKPTVAQVHGHCIAGALNIAMECDLVVATTDALFGMPEARAIGLVPDHGLWPLTIGLRKTKELLFTAELISGSEAARLGMINHAVESESLESFVNNLCRRIAKTSTEMLAIQKASINAAATAIGIDGVRSSGVTFDVMAHLSKTARQWRRVVREQGTAAGIAMLSGADAEVERSPQ